MPNQQSPYTKRITFCMDVIEDAKLERLAYDSGLNKSEVIREAVWEYIAVHAHSNSVRLRRRTNKGAYVRSRYRRNNPKQ